MNERCRLGIWQPRRRRIEVDHHFEELEELHTLLERGPHFDTIISIVVTFNPNRTHYPKTQSKQLSSARGSGKPLGGLRPLSFMRNSVPHAMVRQRWAAPDEFGTRSAARPLLETTDRRESEGQGRDQRDAPACIAVRESPARSATPRWSLRRDHRRHLFPRLIFCDFAPSRPILQEPPIGGRLCRKLTEARLI